MKNRCINFILFATLLLGSCQKGLDLIPKDTISDHTFWKTNADYKLASNNLYLSLEGFNTRDTESDMAFNDPNSISNGTYQTTENDGNWTNPYVYIRRCNNIIEKAANSPIADQVAQFVAEAKFFRAYNYWKLFRLYGEVPLITTVLEISDETLYAPRATRQQTVDLILQDLNDAAASLPEQNALSAADAGRITKGAALALMVRVALFEGSWNKFREGTYGNDYLDIAIEKATILMNGGQYALFTGKGDQSYRYLFIDEGDESSESILDRGYQRDVSGQGFPYTVGIGSLLPTKGLADLYLCSDGLQVTKSPLFQGYNTTSSEFQNRDPRMTMTILIPGTSITQPWYADPTPSWPFYPQRNGNTGYTTYKFLSEEEYANARAGNYSYDLHLIRYAEILLSYAEATYERNGSITDGELDKSINLIRQRVNMPALSNDFVRANGMDMREEIRRERSVELALEGFRYDDLRRWKTAETLLPQEIKGIKIVGTPWAEPIIIEAVDRNPYGGASWQQNTDDHGFIIVEKASSRTFDPLKHYLRPLPTREIFINPELKQNPGW